MRKGLLLLSITILGSFLSGCTTYEERIIDEGTVVEEHMVVE